MRVGVVVGFSSSMEGGGLTFVASLVDAILSCSSAHTFIVFDSQLGESQERSRESRWEKFLQLASTGFGARRVVGSATRRMGLLSPDVSPLTKFIRASRIDVVWFLRPGNPPVSVPYIATVWDLQHRLQPFFPEVSSTGWTWGDRERAYRSCLPRASRIITGTQAGKDNIIDFYGVSPENIIVIPMPVADPTLALHDNLDVDVRVKYGIKGDFLLYPAQFWPHKNHVNLLLALDELRRKANVQLGLVLTGSDKGNLDHVSKTVMALGLSSQVHTLGFVPKADLYGLYREAVALTFASFFGPDNIPPLEAFALDCPVVASRVAGAEEQLGDAAVLFDPADPADIARAILTIQGDPELRAELIQRGRERVSTRSARAYVSQICQVLDDLARIRRCWGQDYAEVPL